MQLHLIVGADHAGFALKEKLKRAWKKQGRTFDDVTPDFAAEDDYPAVAQQVSQVVAQDPRARGVLICGSGIGMAIAANRTRGVRAFLGQTEMDVRLARQDNDANVITLSGRRLSAAKALALTAAFLKVRFSKSARHRRRVQQLDA